MKNISPRGAIIVAALALATAASSGSADVLHVPTDYPTIQHAIDAAQDADEIVVAPGTYFENINLLGKAIHLRSSAGPEKTVIDATGLNTSVVSIISGEGADTVIDGFTITGGTGTQVGFPKVGGGIYSNNSTPTIVNCIIAGNTASNGAGMYSSGATVTKTVFIGNSASGLGGGWVGAGTIIDCEFVGNSAEWGGGYYGSYTSLTNCSFRQNTAELGGGGVGAGGTLENCTFEENTADFGGGLALWYGYDTPAFVIDCSFDGNFATTRGGALMITNIDVFIDDGNFTNNGCTLSGGAIGTFGDVALHITDSTFEGNAAGAMGGAVFAGCYDEVTPLCTTTNVVASAFTGNHAGSHGGAIASGCTTAEYFAGCPKTTVAASTFDTNTAGGFGGAIHNDCMTWVDSDDPTWTHTSCGEVTVSDSALLHNSAGAGGAIANLETSASELAGSFLCRNAPEHIVGTWFDAGGNAFASTADLDCDGSVGVADLLTLLGAWGACDDCTPGDSASCPADLDGDCAVGVSDLLILLQNWG